jgi:hypothetical protein
VKKVNKLFGIFLAVGTVSGTQLLQVPQSSQAQSSSGSLCAAPGKDGVDDGAINIVNTYYPGSTSNTTIAAGATSIPVGSINTQGNQTAISPGDLLLIIQMQDADINFTDTNAYGSGVTTNNGSGSTNINRTGLYEYVVATSGVSGNAIAIRGAGTGGGLINSYRQELASISANGQRTYQVIRVPQYTKATLAAPNVVRSPGAWNGTSGGIVAIDVANTFTLNGTIEVQDKGFRGGGGTQNTDTYPDKEDEAYRTDGNILRGGVKGEGIAGTPRYVFAGGTVVTDTTIDGYPRLKSGDTHTPIGTYATPLTISNIDGGSRARGAPGNAGGGGNQHNSGGGGGGNGGTGGKGGDSIQPKGTTVTNINGTNKPVGGRGGASFAASVTRLIMGGGGGAGDANNGVAGSGGLGGGIVMVRAGSITGTGTISARAANGVDTPTDDGGSGAGAGGSIIIDAKSGSLAGISLNASGGKGGDTHTVSVNSYDFGPGGGGGGGVIISALPLGTATVTGGNYGLTKNGTLGVTTGVPRGAEVGTNGIMTSGLVSSTIPGISSGTNCSVNVSGNVWNDKDGSIIQDSGENGTNAGGLFVYMVDASSKVVAKSTVGSDGSYSMVVPRNVSYTLRLSTDGTKIFADSAPVASLPSTWINTGENKNGTTETITPGEIAVTTTTSDVINQSFAITNSAKVILVKRITAIKSGTTTTTYSIFKDNPATLNDTHPNWPTGFIAGEFDAGIIKPDDEIEYTIYFMNVQGSTARKVRICDRIIGSQAFIQDAYGTNKDIQFKLGTGSVLDFTRAADTTDRAQFYAAGTTPLPTGCNLQTLPVGKKDNGTVAIDITGATGTGQPNLLEIPGATGQATANSYGFFRFKTKVTN